MYYEVISKIASGTFGTVYKVIETVKKQTFALKLIHENYKTPKELKRIKRGFETAQKVSHPNCVKMIEWYAKGNDVGFVMEFVETIDVLTQEEDLTGFQKPVRSGNLTDKISKIIQIANGLEALHQKGIVHRDLKPANILETKKGQIKITDFDLVKLDDASTITVSGAFLGTVKYSSPEQCQSSKNVDFRSDLYSLGILFYEMVTGRTPFEGESLAEIALAHIRTPLISPKQFVPDLPEELNFIISKLLKKDPSERFESAQEVANLLHTFLQKGSIPSLETINEFLLSPGFVGRRQEFAKLDRIYSEVSNGKLKTVLLSGEQGVGKTKLWNEFKLGITQNSELIFETKCLESSKSFESLQPILSKALEQIDNLPSKEQAKKIGKFGRLLSAISPNFEKNLFFNDLEELKIAKGIDLEQKLFNAFTTFLKNIHKENTTLILFFDNLQWINEQCLNFLIYFTKNLTDKSILLVGAVRVEETERISSNLKEANTLEIENFNIEEIREFTTKLFGKLDPVSTEFCEEILSRTSGNVLFIQELMFHFFETKKLQKSNGNWNLDEELFWDTKIPKSIQSVVNERVNFLQKDVLELLEVGSLLGEYFKSDVIPKILSIDKNEVEKKLTDSSLNGILHKIESGVFEFQNVSIKECVNCTINEKLKKSYHEKIGNYLEKEFQEGEVLADLAEHYFYANNKKKAIDFGLKVADNFEQKQIFKTAIEYLSKIIDFIEKTGEEELQVSSFLKLGRMNYGLNDLKKSDFYFSKALEYAKSDSNNKALTFIALGELNRAFRKFDKSFEFYEKALKVFEKTNNLVEVGRTNLRFSFLYSFIGEPQKAEEYLEIARKFGEKTKSLNIIGQALFLQGNIASTDKKYQKAEKLYKKSYQFLKEHGDITGLISFHLHFAGNYRRMKKYELAKKNYAKCSELADEMGLIAATIQCQGNIGSILLSEGKIDKAIEFFNKAISSSTDFNSFAYPWILNFLARANFLSGEFDKSEEIIKKQIPICIQAKSESYLALLYVDYGELLNETKRYEKAINFYEKATPLLGKFKNFENICLALYNTSKSYFAQRDFQKAKEFCKKAIEYLDRDFELEILKTKVKIQKELIEFELGNKNEAIDSLLELKEGVISEESKFEVAFEICKLFEEKKTPYLLEKKINFRKLKDETIAFLKEEYKTKKIFFTKKRIKFLEKTEFKSNEIYPELISALTNWMNPETVFDELLKFLLQETNAGSCQIILKNEKGFEPIATSSNLKEDEIEFSTTVLKKAIEDEKPTLLKNVLEIPELKENQSVIGKIFLSVIAVPLKVKDKIMGALYLDRRKIAKGFFTNSDLEKVNTIAKILSPVLQRQNEAAKMKIESEIHKLGIFVGNSSQMQDVYSEIEEAAKVNFTVYIYGETGTGKELVANSLHQLSLRRNEPFVAINCSVIPKDLAESELFGHTKGAFSGATSDKKGKFELADKGTIFLDEVAELSLDIQAKLLRVIQENEVWKVGAEKATKINTRIVIATHKNLEEEVEKGNFRKDLYYRIAFLKIQLPPLRERKEDIVPLAYHFLRKYNEETGKNLKGFSQNSIDILNSQKWEGNVRELENFIALCFVKTKETKFINLSKVKGLEVTKPASEKKVTQESNSSDTELEKNILSETGLNDKIGALEKYLVIETLKKHNFHLQKTYKELEVNNKRLDRLLKKHNIDISELKESTL